MEQTNEQLTIEDDLAISLGLTRDEMRALRREHLEEGVTWRREAKRVVLTDQGVAMVRAALGITEKIPEKKEGGAVDLVVDRVPRNPRILEAKKNDGSHVRVRVKSNANFLPGMLIRAMPEGEFDDVMTLDGRCPRWRGRW